MLREGYTGRKTDSLGRARCYSNGRPVPCASMGAEHGGQAAVDVLGNPAGATKAQLSDLARHLSSLTVPEIKQLQAHYLASAAGRQVKADRVAALVAWAKGQTAKAPAAKAAPATGAKPAAPVSPRSRVRNPAAMARAAEVLGGPVDAADLHAVVGDVGTGEVTASHYAAPSVSMPHGRLQVKYDGPTHVASRILYRNFDGEREMVADHFAVFKDKLPPGVTGTDLFAGMLDAARRMGVVRIRTYAGGDGADTRQPDSLNGYYTWPRLGYDGDIEKEELAKLPAGLKRQMGGSKSILDLMATPEGRAWWKANGSGLDLTFDTDPNSRSSRTLEAYRAERK